VLSGNELLTVLAADLRKAQPPVRRIPVPNLGLKSPTGATFDPATGTWYVLDDGTKTIVRVPMPGGSPGTPARISLQGLGDVSLQGLAFNPADGLFYVANPTQNLLYGLDSSGTVQKTYSLNAIELGGAGLQDLRALVFAPSADPTDNPSTQHLFIADAGSTSILGGVAEVSLAEATVASTEQGTLVQTIETSRFNPPSPDPAGITYLRPRDSLEICDSEVDEMTIFRGVNLWQVTRTGTVTDTGATFPHPPNAKEPTGLGFKPADGTLFVSDDNRRRVFLIRPGADGRYGTSDDRQVGSIDVTTFGLPVDAEGVEFDTRSGHVFIADGVGREVWRVNPGPNRTFGNADDVVTHFDVGRYGALDPEGIGHVAARSNLVIVDDPSETVYEVTKSGGLVRTIDISGVPGVRRPAGITLAPGTNDPTRMNLWIVDRVVDNNANPNENDGRLYEISWPSAPPT
jgi:sugar lactone lactonase YvrE